MTPIEQLILDLCPNGVPVVKLGDCCTTKSAPKSLDKKDYLTEGEYPIVDQGQKFIVAYTNDSEALIPEGQYVIFGDHTREIKFVDFAFAQGADGVKILIANPTILPKYLYYAMTNLQITSRGYNRHWSIARELPLPLPPRPLQEKIVEILDKFSLLSAELEAELEGQKKRYEYYRTRLLSFDSDSDTVQWKTLGEVCEKVCSGGTPARNITKYFEGTIPWMRTHEVDWRDVYDTEIKITDEAVANSSAKLIPKNCVIIAMYGATAGKSCINKIPVTTNQACCNLQINPKQALYKYVYYWVCNRYEDIKSMGEGSQNNINAQKVKAYPIPIPSLERQAEIVRILDKFETLVTDLSQGLPAEIQLVQHQYEYYRNKLLTFNPSFLSGD